MGIGNFVFPTHTHTLTPHTHTHAYTYIHLPYSIPFSLPYFFSPTLTPFKNQLQGIRSLLFS